MKKILGILIALFLVGLVSAGLIGISTREVGITTQSENILKDTNDIDGISIHVGDLNCDGSYCHARVYQENLINTEFRTNQKYCIEYEENVTEGYTTQRCILYKDKTRTELNDELNNWVEKRINDYASVQDTRRNKEEVKIEDEVNIIKEVR